MTNHITDSKPEPISAIPNWHYDSYFLAQLERSKQPAPDIITKSHKVSLGLKKRIVDKPIVLNVTEIEQPDG